MADTTPEEKPEPENRGPFAHSNDGPRHTWEPLFTSFGDGENTCQRSDCPKCRDLQPQHGHLNKVAYWTAKFVGEMFLPGETHEAARQWGYLASRSAQCTFRKSKKTL